VYKYLVNYKKQTTMGVISMEFQTHLDASGFRRVWEQTQDEANRVYDYINASLLPEDIKKAIISVNEYSHHGKGRKQKFIDMRCAISMVDCWIHPHQNKNKCVLYHKPIHDVNVIEFI